MVENLAPKTRRRKFGSDGNTLGRRKLGLVDDAKDPNFDYRWVNDAPGRIQRMEAIDWDIVEDRSGALMPGQDRPPGSGVEAHAGMLPNSSGKQMRSVLMRKRKDLRDEDNRKVHRPKIDERAAQLKGQGPEQLTEEFYVPDDRRDALSHQTGRK